jgi:hypothetical protein
MEKWKRDHAVEQKIGTEKIKENIGLRAPFTSPIHTPDKKYYLFFCFEKDVFHAIYVACFAFRYKDSHFHKEKNIP